MVRQRQLLEAARRVAEDKTHVFGGADVGQTPAGSGQRTGSLRESQGSPKAPAPTPRWQRASARRTPGSRGWHEAQRRIAAVHRRITGLRENAHHQLSRLLIRKYAVLAIESLNVAGMDKLRHQARSIRDAAIGGLLQKVRYKAEWYGTLIVEADRFFPPASCAPAAVITMRSSERESALELPAVRHRARPQRERRPQPGGLALKAVDELPGKLILGPVGPDVTLPDGKALADGKRAAGETGPGEGRTAPPTQPPAAVDGGVARNSWRPKGGEYPNPAQAGYLIIAYIPDNPYTTTPSAILNLAQQPRHFYNMMSRF